MPGYSIIWLCQDVKILAPAHGCTMHVYKVVLLPHTSLDHDSALLGDPGILPHQDVQIPMSSLRWRRHAVTNVLLCHTFSVDSKASLNYDSLEQYGDALALALAQ